jgi:anti-anti-sigma factor
MKPDQAADGGPFGGISHHGWPATAEGRMSVVRIERQGESRACVVALEGEIDLAVVPEIRDELDAVIGTGCTNVLLDLADVTYADSTALGLLVWADRKLAPLGGKLVLCGANSDVNRILELSGLVGVAPTISARATLADALAGVELDAPVEHPLWTESLTTPADIEKLAGTRLCVTDLIEPLGIDDAAVFDIKVAVGEALANAVRHGSPHGSQDHIVVTVTAFSDRVSISVMDSGCGFDGSPSASDDVYAPSGRGVMFMRALMDSVQFARCPGGGTMVTLVKSTRTTE